MSPSGKISEAMVEAAMVASRDKRLNTLTNSNAMRFILEAALSVPAPGTGGATTEALKAGLNLLLLAEMIRGKRFDAILSDVVADQLEEADALLQRLSALSSSPVGEMDGWRDMSSAPKDGTLVLLAKAGDPDWPMRCRRWQDNHWRGQDASDATHWRPLPASPQGGR